MLSALALIWLTTEPAALMLAREHLQAGKHEEVLFDLDGQAIPDKDKGAAADLLALAASRALTVGDDLLALQMAQMALRHNPKHAVANQTAMAASKKQKQYESAERYADAWLAASNSPEARLARAQLAQEQGEWERVLSLLPSEETAKLNRMQLQQADMLRKLAQRNIDQRTEALSQLKGLEEKMNQASTDAKQLAVAETRDAKVIVYSAEWCGYCKRAKSWLAERSVPFVEKDIEKDSAAAEELAMKAAAANVRPRGVPVIDVRGSLVLGFDEPRLKALLGTSK